MVEVVGDNTNNSNEWSNGIGMSPCRCPQPQPPSSNATMSFRYCWCYHQQFTGSNWRKTNDNKIL